MSTASVTGKLTQVDLSSLPFNGGWGGPHARATGEVVHHPRGDVVHPGQDLLLDMFGYLPIAQQGGAADPFPSKVGV